MKASSIGLSLFLVFFILADARAAAADDERGDRPLRLFFEMGAATTRGTIQRTDIARSELRPRIGARLFGFLDLAVTAPVGVTDIGYRGFRKGVRLATHLSSTADLAIGGDLRLTFTRRSAWLFRSGLGIETLISDGGLHAETMSAIYGGVNVAELLRLRSHVAFGLWWQRVTSWVELARRYRWGAPYLILGLQDLAFVLGIRPDSSLHPYLPATAVGRDGLTLRRDGTGAFAEAGVRARLSRSFALDVGGSSTLPLRIVLFSAHVALACTP